VAEHATDIVLSGSVDIDSSQDITIECLTIIGSGPGIRIHGSLHTPSMGINIRSMNLLYNDGPCLEFGENYYRVIVSCTNIHSDPLLSATTKEILQRNEIHVSCTRLSQGEISLQPDLAPIRVAVIDSGIDRSIPALGCYLWKNPGEVSGNGVDDDANGYIDDVYGWDFSDGDADSLVGSPLHWHGTFVAGVLANAFEAELRAVNQSGSLSLQIMDLRVLDSGARFYRSEWQNIADAIDYAVNKGARIINLSIYATFEPPVAVREAVLHAVESGVLVVGIAGNDSSSLGPISNWPEILTIAAVDEAGNRADFSNTGAEVDFAALGVNVLSLIPGGAGAVQSGTSFAAPAVAGIASFYASIDQQISPRDLEVLLRIRAADVGMSGMDEETGWGLIQ
jgi:subtilisin family serine protease